MKNLDALIFANLRVSNEENEMLNDSYWKEYNDGEMASLYSSDNKKIAIIQKQENGWDCTIYPKYIAEGFYLMNIDSIEEAEWQMTLYIHNRCNEIANQLHKIRDHLPSIHELAKRARIIND